MRAELDDMEAELCSPGPAIMPSVRGRVALRPVAASSLSTIALTRSTGIGRRIGGQRRLDQRAYMRICALSVRNVQRISPVASTTPESQRGRGSHGPNQL